MGGFSYTCGATARLAVSTGSKAWWDVLWRIWGARSQALGMLWRAGLGGSPVFNLHLSLLPGPFPKGRAEWGVIEVFNATSGSSSSPAGSPWALPLLLVFQTSAGDTGPYWEAVRDYSLFSVGIVGPLLLSRAFPLPYGAHY